VVALDLRRAATYTEHLIATGWIVLVTTIKLDKAGFENSLCSHLYDLDVTPADGSRGQAAVADVWNFDCEAA
jgi:hypothetical protein